LSRKLSPKYFLRIPAVRLALKQELCLLETVSPVSATATTKCSSPKAGLKRRMPGRMSSLSEKLFSSPFNAQPVWKQVVYFFIPAVAAGAMIGGAWRDEQLGWIGVTGIALFLFVQSNTRSLPQSLLHAFITGLVSFAVACPWLPSTTRYLVEAGEATSLVFSLAYYAFQSLGLVLFAAIWRWIRTFERSPWLLVPVVWLGVEQLVPTLFPWPPAVLLTGDLPMLQVAEFGGVQLASMLVLAIATYLAWTIELAFKLFSKGYLQRQAVRVWIFIFIGLFGVRYFSDYRFQQVGTAIDSTSGTELRVGIVQADTGFNDSNQRMVEATREMDGLIDLAVWPESALGDYCRELTDFNDPELVSRLSVGEDTRFVPFPEPHCPLLAGADTWDDEEADGTPDRHFVSALLIDRLENLIGSREKVRLMPYGEYIPGESLLPFLRAWWGSKRVVSAGAEPKPIGRIGELQLGVLLCCEDMHPGLVRELVSRGANFLVTLGNGMAFDSEIALRQHFRIAQLRAIEHRLYFLRCTSSGVSGLIAPSGRVLHELPTMRDAAAVISIPQRPTSLGATLFTRAGSLLPLSLGLIATLTWIGLQRSSRGIRGAQLKR
jgi:apolipoprotein N-acyltransferase